MSTNEDSVRGARLKKLLESYIHGDRSPKSAGDGKLLLESIAIQDDRASCIERLVGSKNALAALRLALRFNTAPIFFNTTLKDFLKFLGDPTVGHLCGGQLLKQLLTIVVRPTTIWDAFVTAFVGRQLTPEGELAFAWLLLELLSWTDNPPVDVDSVARDLSKRKVFIKSDDYDLRTIGYRIDHVLKTKSHEIERDDFGPGGRHDNDHLDFRKVAICPTDDELSSEQIPFYRPANAISQQAFKDRPGLHLENQFRLLREDFLAELREDVHVSQGHGKIKRPRLRLRGLSLSGAHFGTSKFKTPFALALTVQSGLEGFARMASHKRKAYLKDNIKFLKHQSFGCVLDRERVVTFATLFRVEELLIQGKQPTIVLRTPDSATLENLLSALKSSDTLEFAMVDTPIFAYEPVLRCLQSTVELPLWEELFALSDEEINAAVRPSSVAPLKLIDKIQTKEASDLQSVLSLPKPVTLDESQLSSLLAGLRQSVSLIQGPPGTGKSFLGALLTKALLEHTSETILVVCYTNHALDQFLEELLDTGVPAEWMVRLGQKSTTRTEPLQLRKQASVSNPPWSVINAMKEETDSAEFSLNSLLVGLQNFQPGMRSIMELLEFSEGDSDFHDALLTPEYDPDEHLVGKRGNRITDRYLWDRWRHGQDAGVFQATMDQNHPQIWAMNRSARDAKLSKWKRELLQERISGIGTLVESYNRSEGILRSAWGQKDSHIIRSKRIIACTTTAAAMYTKHLRAAAPGIIVVEEAGEILESHVLTAMTPKTKQLILIGDHQQLRPKVNNYALTVERGDGFDLNRSLFERLILSGFPHTTLSQQHRMCPEISSLIRSMTYEDLVDAPSTLGRNAVKGIRGRVILIDHRNSELAASQIPDRRDQGSTISKQNPWEASMVLKVVKYMAQQGYGTADQVVLTPYLGQLSLLRQELARAMDPVLNDLDSHDLVKAGLMSSSSAGSSKRQIRLSTIDNFQGDEADIVVASLTRSNDNGDVGFMAAPERLNVLLSRARNTLIIIGDSETFLASKKGASTWKPFFDLLKQSNSIHDGLPVKCEQHPDRQNVLKQPLDFDTLCPDGGCSAPCGVMLSCGLHECQQRCHALADHSKMACLEIVRDRCPKQHKLTWRCSKLRPASCPTCDAEARAIVKRQEADARLDEVRQQKQEAYARQLAEIQDRIDRSLREVQEQNEDEEREAALLQRQKDLENVLRRSERVRRQKQATQATVNPRIPGSFEQDSTAGATGNTADPEDGTSSPEEDDHDAPEISSAARDDWEHQKEMEGATNEHLDELMAMIGLENVKAAFLEIKARVDLTVRQGTSLTKERFGASLLGNPGTGKTTVARLYAKFISSVGALPGDEFVETTGAKLANEGVQACTKILDGIKKAGGGALFIDEAYQLTSGSSFGGGAVLDYLLAEVENLTGRVVFILAGYNKNMESFFAHNPGLPSRFPRQIQFTDYEDAELLEIFNYGLEKKYGQRMAVEGGCHGLYARIVSRRLGRGRGKVGFGNARAVENALSLIASRQAKRVHQERRRGKMPDDMLLTKEDLIGAEPANVLKDNRSWKKLHQLTGLASVKESISALFDSITYNYHRELEEKPIMDFSLNKVFIGSPGTGKTTVAKLYGQILADIGLLSTNETVLKTPADFVGSVLGASEANTKGILEAAKGKVLIIDEAYGLYSASDPYKTAVVDTIVAEVQSIPGDDRCVLLLGYKEQMEEMMQNVNPGLARRFPIDSGFLFEDFNDDEMATIFDAKLKMLELVTTERGRSVALEVLSRMRNRPNFGNAGQIDILLNDAKVRQQKRFARDRMAMTAIFEAEDFDPDFERAARASTNIEKLFSGVAGCDRIVMQMKDYQNIAANMRDAGMDPRDTLPFTFLFRGPPGTGKTTTARKMGKVYYDMGFLATAEVVECSAKDLVGEYVGQTGPKAQKLIESALGKVLFVDEAYRLGEGLYGKEAVDELVDSITKPQFFNKLVVILAGYDHEINRMLDVNPGLSSRFSESVDFQKLSPESCYQLLRTTLEKKSQLDTSRISGPSDSFHTQMLASFGELSALENFANGRDVQTVCKGIVKTIMKATKPADDALVVTEAIVIEQIDCMVTERAARGRSADVFATPQVSAGAQLPRMKTRDMPAPPVTASASTFAVESKTTPVAEAQQIDEIDESSHGPEDNPHEAATSIRDANVSDAIWNQLQKDAQKAEEEERECQRLAEEEEQLRQWLKKCADAKRELKLAEIDRKRKELEEKLRRQALEQEKLAKMGICPAGFHWIRQSGGYRCAGGSHWVSDGQMQKMCQ